MDVHSLLYGPFCQKMSPGSLYSNLFFNSNNFDGLYSKGHLLEGRKYSNHYSTVHSLAYPVF